MPALPGAQGGDLVAAGSRWAGIAGLVLVALTIVLAFLPGMPGVADTQSLADQLTAHATGQQAAGMVWIFSDIAFLVFVTGVWSLLHRAEGRAAVFSTLFLVGGVVSEALYLVSGALHLAAVRFGLFALPKEGLPALTVLSGWVNAAGRAPATAMYLGAAVVILAARVLPRWLGWLALAVAGLSLLDVAGLLATGPVSDVFTFIDWAGFAVTEVWTLAVALLLVAGARSRTSSTT